MNRTFTALALLAISCLSRAQTPNPEPMAKEPPLPIVSFDFVLPGSTPPHYAISVEPDGKATYRSDEVDAADAVPQQPYLHQFLVSEPARKQIFELTLALNCFQGDFEFRGHSIANMGAKTLKCVYADRQSQTTYNYSQNRQLQELTTIFQNMANTMEAGRRLVYLHRYDKLGLEAQLKSMEDEEKNKRLGELQAIAAQLEQVVNDGSVLNVTRRRAEHLLQVIKSNPSARAAATQ